MKCVLCCVIFSSLMTSGLALTGNGYLTMCNTYLQLGGESGMGSEVDYRKAIDSAMCMGYHRGVIEARGIWETVSKFKTICLPDGVTDDQTIRVVVKYLNENPANLHTTAAALVMVALKEAFPCKKEN